ncbi:MAG: flavoprotein [Aminipila sp.]
MSRKNLENIICEVLISYIAERVVEKIAMHNKKVLVVFTGSLINFDEAMESLKKLKEDGFAFELFFSESAQSLLDLSKIKEILQPKEIYQDSMGLPEQLAKSFETVLVPTMTINTASKIANCMADTPASRLILSSIMRGKNVIIGIDGCCPDNKERVAKGYKMKEPLKAQLRENMKKMASYGAYLTTLENLFDNTKKKVLSTEPKGNNLDEKKAVTIANAESRVLSKKVIGNVDILSNVGYKTIKISSDALVTKLAEETAQKNKIQLIRE